MRRIIIMIFAIFLLLGSISAFAEESNTMDHANTHGSHQVEVQKEQVTHESHDQGSHTSHSSVEHEKDSHSSVEGHHESVVETPPNYILLGFFISINVFFILIGIWLKWFHKKGATA